MRNRILGIIGVVWGGAILISWVARGMPMGRSAYAFGQMGALVFAVVLLLAGLYYALKRGKSA
jgi:hypothetical protein